MNHYDVLGVASTAPTAEVRKAYVALARLHHPDRTGGDANRMRAVNEAWATLRDPGRRALYDLSLQNGPPMAAAAHPRGEWREADDLLADLADDTPFGARVVLPRWLSLLPVGVFAASVVLFCAALMFRSAPAMAVALALFVLSCTMFLAAPFVALLVSRRSAADRQPPPGG